MFVNAPKEGKDTLLRDIDVVEYFWTIRKRWGGVGCVTGFGKNFPELFIEKVGFFFRMENCTIFIYKIGDASILRSLWLYIRPKPFGASIIRDEISDVGVMRLAA